MQRFAVASVVENLIGIILYGFAGLGSWGPGALAVGPRLMVMRPDEHPGA